MHAIMAYQYAVKMHEARQAFLPGYDKILPSRQDYLSAVKSRATRDQAPANPIRAMLDRLDESDEAVLDQVEELAADSMMFCDCLAGPSDHRRGCRAIDPRGAQEKALVG